MSVGLEDHRLLYRIARAYYVEGQTQQQISERFGVSRPKVSRLLQRARDMRVVNITLVPPPGGRADLEHGLEQRYGLDEAIVVPISDPDDPDSIALELGPVAADCLLRLLEPNCTLGLAWGRSLLVRSARHALLRVSRSSGWECLSTLQNWRGLRLKALRPAAARARARNRLQLRLPCFAR